MQLFVLNNGQGSDVFVLDECGALFCAHHERGSPDTIVAHYQRFFECLAIAPNETSITTRRSDTEFTSKRVSKKKKSTKYFGVSVEIDADAAGNQQLAINVAGRGFSTHEHKGALFAETAQFVIDNRDRRETYPIYITDLKLSHRFRARKNIVSSETIHLLTYKQRIEQQRTRAIRARMRRLINFNRRAQLTEAEIQ